ncbi:hypothetical protein [Allobranchiibius sp. CTAmp26]|uniref:hypothetical protein n=1 Tax=Allobranchiibius sp. CTAmp26 TaxID=2815214 RepID=UPI001AA14A08|nr:hypothetical protein [Allobranchiibius sp. CTAmp26]MBO1755629.1 hypothetical protein [Allobranchiibius sp. CTAmp26]
MQPYQVDESTGSRLIGGDMLAWADLPAVPTLTAVGYLMSRVARLQDAASVLLLGPRAGSLLAGLPTHLKVDVLVRGLPDARALSALSGLRSHLNVYCGGFDFFDPSAAYDLVVCLDGPEVLQTPDSQGMSHAEALSRCARFTNLDGLLIATISNQLGLDHLFRLEMRSMYDADDQWYRGAPGFDVRRPYPRELGDLLEQAGLRASSRYCVFPSPTEPSLLASTDVLDDPLVGGHLSALIHATEGRHFSERPSLVDPYQLSRTMIDAGMAFDLAPLWLIVAQRSEASIDSGPVLPSVIAGEDGTLPEWTAVSTMSSTPDGWARGVHSPQNTSEMTERRVGRDLSIVGQRVPTGRILEAVLREACAGGNIATIRRIVQGYAEWLTDADRWSGTAGRRRFFATPDNVMQGADGDFDVFDPSWYWAEHISADLSVQRGLRVFARRLLRSGGEHPWKPDISPDALAQTLCVMADLPWSSGTSNEIASREAELQVAVFGGDSLAENQSFTTNLESGVSQFSSTPGPSRGYRESLDLTGRMSSELFDRGGQVVWLESTVRQRDVQVGELENTLASVRASVSFKIGRGVTLPGRAVVKSGRRAALSALPPGIMSKVERAIRGLSARR